LGLPALKADEVVFKNGDHLKGKIESMDGGKMTLSGTVAGKGQSTRSPTPS
jgi:hypothetical protein